MTLLSPNHNHAADKCIAQIPLHRIPTTEEKVRASESFNKSVLVAAHMAALHDAYILEMATHPVNEVTIKPSSPTSSIGGLKPSTLKQLKVGKVHRRRVVNGTLCVKALCTKSHDGLMVANVLEDEQGNATPIYLSNAMEGNGGSAQAQRLYPQGSKVAVKEPYLTRLPNGEIVLLVEKTTDLVFLWVPNYVEEKGIENGGSKENGFYEDGRNAFAEDNSVCSGGRPRNEDADMKKGDGFFRELGVVEEGANSAKACLEPKFEVAMNVKEEKRSDEGGIESRSIGELQGGVEGNAEGIPDGKACSSREMILEDMVAVEGEEGQVGAVDAPNEVGRREVSWDDLLAMRKGEGDGGDGEEPEGKIKGPQLGEAESRDIQKEEVKEQVLNEGGLLEELEPIQGVVEASQVHVGAGNASEKTSEVLEAETREVKKEEVMEEALNEGDAEGRDTAASLRAKGNALFTQGDFNNAVSVYLRGAETARSDGSKMEEMLCLSNRAEVSLRLCRNQAALDDAEAALKLLRESEGLDAGDLALAKALFRKGRALMGLHKYEDGMRALQEVLANAPADRMLREATLKCRRHLEHVLKPGKRQRAAANRQKNAAASKQRGE